MSEPTPPVAADGRRTQARPDRAHLRCDDDKAEKGQAGTVDVDALPALIPHDDGPHADLLRTSAAEEAQDRRWTTSRPELWAFYTYYIGCSGTPFNFGPSQFQNLLALACTDDPDGTCRLDFAGRRRDVSSIVLVCNGISFAIQAVLFLIIGSYADYGRWRPFVLIAFTALAVGVSFAWIGVEDPGQWKTAVGLYIVGLVSYQGALSYWTAAFPRLAEDLPEVRESARMLVKGETTHDEHAQLDMLSRNRISNISFTICSAGEVVVLAVLCGILTAIHSDRSVEDNTRALSIVCAYSAAVWVVCALPWFVLEKHRPGQPLPPGSTYLTAGIVQLWTVFKVIGKLKQTMIYLALYFLLGDVLNTSVTQISILQNSIVSYSTFKLNELLIVGIVAQMIGIYGFWMVQKRFAISTKRMFEVVVFFTLLLQVWGLIGVGTDKFHNEWEVWAYQAYYGLFVCPWYAYSQTMISSVAPRGKEFLFFSVFSVIGRTSSFIGPFVSSAITDDSGNDNMPFAFLLALGCVSSALLFFIDEKQSKKECADFLASEERELRLFHGGSSDGAADVAVEPVPADEGLEGGKEDGEKAVGA